MRALLLRLSTFLFAFLLIETASSLFAQDSKEELCKAAANPLAELMSFPFENNLNINQGDHHRNTSIFNIQPVLPFAGGRIITRTVLPVLWIPDVSWPSGMYATGRGN